MSKNYNKELEISSSTSPDALPMDVYMQILSHWNQPLMWKKKDGVLYFSEFSQPDREIDDLLKEENIVPPDLNGEEEFHLRFRTACKFSKKLTSRPHKDELKRSYKTRTRKLKKLLDDLDAELRSYTREEFAYFSDIIQRQADYMLDAADDQKLENISPNFCKYMTVLRGAFYIHDAAENNLYEVGNKDAREAKRILEEWEGSPEFYLKNYEGGHGKAKSKKAALCAIAESYLICFGEMPTSTENSTFMKYGKVLYEFLDTGSITDSSLYQDAKSAIAKLKNK